MCSRKHFSSISVNNNFRWSGVNPFTRYEIERILSVLEVNKVRVVDFLSALSVKVILPAYYVCTSPILTLIITFFGESHNNSVIVCLRGFYDDFLELLPSLFRGWKFPNPCNTWCWMCDGFPSSFSTLFDRFYNRSDELPSNSGQLIRINFINSPFMWEPSWSWFVLIMIMLIKLLISSLSKIC